jgi:hypothetical protein
MPYFKTAIDINQNGGKLLVFKDFYKIYQILFNRSIFIKY